MTSDAVTIPVAAKPSGPVLELFVLNAGYGESIVVHLPNGRWGVVDCYAKSLEDPNSNLALQLLEEHGVTELEFLCLTHPHVDHFYGMTQILRRFSRIRLFWRFPHISADELLVLYLLGNGKEFEDKAATQEAEEFRNILQVVRERRNRRGSDKIRIKHGALGVPIYPPGDLEASNPGISIIGLAPCGDRVESYKEHLTKCFDETGRLRPRPPKLEANELSLGLLIKYGQSRIVLGGDVEESNWKEVLREWPRAGLPDLGAHGVKVSHHGSTNGYCDGLWEALSNGTKPIAAC